MVKVKKMLSMTCALGSCALLFAGCCCNSGSSCTPCAEETVTVEAVECAVPAQTPAKTSAPSAAPAAVPAHAK